MGEWLSGHRYQGHDMKNAIEHLAYLAEQQASATSGSIRSAMYHREGVDATDDAFCRGLRVWALERLRYGGRSETTIVFGRSCSDALRRASTPARLGEEEFGDLTYAAEILGAPDDQVVWPAMERSS